MFSSPRYTISLLFLWLVMGLRWSGSPGLGRAGSTGPARPTILDLIGPVRPINFLLQGPQPGRARQVYIQWAAARPGPSYFYRASRGQARPFIVLEDGSWPGPAQHVKRFKFSEAGLRPGPARQLFQRMGRDPAHHWFKFVGPARSSR